MKRIIYTRKDCPGCIALKEWLKSMRLKYIEKDVDSLGNLEELINTYPKVKTVPVLIIDAKLYTGMEIVKWMEQYEAKRKRGEKFE